MLARDNVEVDDGWLCDKGRFAFQMFNSEERITQPMVRAGDGSLSPISWDEAVNRSPTRSAAPARRRPRSSAAAPPTRRAGWSRRSSAARGSSNVDCSASPVDAGLLGELSRPELGSQDGGPRPRRRDPGDRRRPAARDADPRPAHPQGGPPQPRQADGRLRAPDRRSTAERHEAIRYAPGDAASFVSALAGALGADGYDAEGPFEKEAAAIAEILRDAPDQTIVWGERLWRNPGAVEALHACARALEMHQRIGPGLLEVPEESNGRGLREVGCLPGAKPGLEPAAGRTAAAPRSRTASPATSSARLLLVNADPVRTHPDSEGWRKALAGSFVVSIASFEDESTRLANIVIPAETYAEKEGTVTHPDGRLQRLRRNVPLPEGMIPGWRFLDAVAAELGSGLDAGVARRDLRRALERGPVLRLDHLRGDRRNRVALGRQGPGAVVDAGPAGGGVRGPANTAGSSPGRPLRPSLGGGTASWAPTATSGRPTSPSGIQRCAS